MQEGHFHHTGFPGTGTFFGYRNLPVQERNSVVGYRWSRFGIRGYGTINRGCWHGNQRFIADPGFCGIVWGSQYNHARETQQAENCIL